MEPPSRTLPPGGAELSVLVPERRWHRAVPGVERLVRRAVEVAGGGPAAVVLDSDRAVRRLNAVHRGRNKATNVLTFPRPLAGGDVVVALGVVRREAADAGRTAGQHLAHLVVHAMLHLDGHDHGGAGEARRMEREEARLLSRLRVPNPWKPRAVAAAGGDAEK